MDQSSNSDDLATVCRIHGCHHLVLGLGYRLVFVAFGRPRNEGHKVTTRKVRQQELHPLARDIQTFGQVLNRPGLRTAVPKQEQSFEMRDALNAFENKVIDATLTLWIGNHFPVVEILAAPNPGFTPGPYFSPELRERDPAPAPKCPEHKENVSPSDLRCVS